jgi:hypothetical protein
MIDLAFQSFSLLVGWFMLGLKCLTGTTFNNIPLGFYKRKTISIKRNESNPKVGARLTMLYRL